MPLAVPSATQRHTSTRRPIQMDGANPAATTTLTSVASRMLTSAIPAETMTIATATIAATIALTVSPVPQGTGSVASRPSEVLPSEALSAAR